MRTIRGDESHLAIRGKLGGRCSRLRTLLVEMGQRLYEKKCEPCPRRKDRREGGPLCLRLFGNSATRLPNHSRDGDMLRGSAGWGTKRIALPLSSAARPRHLPARETDSLRSAPADAPLSLINTDVQPPPTQQTTRSEARAPESPTLKVRLRTSTRSPTARSRWFWLSQAHSPNGACLRGPSSRARISGWEAGLR
jgi:hypothetical protein